jgi:hypothetical protein
MKKTIRITMIAALVFTGFGAGRLMAGTPFGGDDLGTIPSDAPKGPVTKCETGVAKAAGKLVGAVVKCHASRASGKLADDTAEDTCEGTAITKFAATKTAGCATCTGGATGLMGLGTAIVMNLDMNNNKVACTTTGTPFGGDDTGNIPADAPKGPVTKCEGLVGKGVSKLVGSIIKCHGSRVAGKLADDTAEDTCEGAAKTKFEATKTAGCDPCLGSLSTLADFVESQADGALNAVVWCGSPSGAFLY